MSEQDKKIITLGVLRKFKDDYDTKITTPLKNNVKALEYVINNSNRLSYSGETITNSNSAVGDIRNIIVNGNTRYKKTNGTYTDTWESGISLESVGEKEKDSNGKYTIEIVSCGSKNLCLKDKINWTDNHGGGSLNALTPFLEEGKVYTIYGNNDNSSYNLYINILNYNWDTKIANGGVPFTFTYSKDMKVIQFLNDTVWTSTSVSQLQIKKGENNNSTFEEYKENKRNILLDSPLRKAGEVTDVLDLEKMKVTRNCNSVTFDGSSDENWTYAGNNIFALPFSGYRKVDLTTNSLLICDKFTVTSHNVLNNISGNYIAFESSYTIDNYIKIRKTDTTDLATFKTWLQSNPVTIVYELATPITEDIGVSPTDNPLQSYNDSTTLTLNNTIKGNISADMPTNLSGVITQQASAIASLQDTVLQTQSALIENEYNNLT